MLRYIMYTKRILFLISGIFFSGKFRLRSIYYSGFKALFYKINVIEKKNSFTNQYRIIETVL